jgi:pimeloyl-ACP methyl ester carboxylesterase
VLFVQDDLQLYFTKIGSSGIPIIFLHGLGVDQRGLKHHFEQFFGKCPQLAAQFIRYYLDLPGMGYSNRPPDIRSSDDILHALLEFISTSLGEQEIIVIGESYGGYLARGIINQRFSQILGAELICPVIIPEKDQRNLPPHEIIYLDRDFKQALLKMDADVVEYMQSAVILTKETWWNYREFIQSALDIADKEFIKSLFFEHYKFSDEIDLAAEPYRFPVFFLLGRQDNVVGYQDAQKIFDNFQSGSMFVADGAGHNLIYEKPDFFEIITRHFFNSVLDDKSKKRG